MMILFVYCIIQHNIVHDGIVDYGTYHTSQQQVLWYGMVPRLELVRNKKSFYDFFLIPSTTTLQAHVNEMEHVFKKWWIRLTLQPLKHSR